MKTINIHNKCIVCVVVYKYFLSLFKFKLLNINLLNVMELKIK